MAINHNKIPCMGNHDLPNLKMYNKLPQFTTIYHGSIFCLWSFSHYGVLPASM